MYQKQFDRFEQKVWLSSPTMHGEELEYIKEAFDTNWMSTVGKNIDETERMACEKAGCKYAVALSAGTASIPMSGCGSSYIRVQCGTYVRYVLLGASIRQVPLRIT